jgi:FtsZ-interacting cell division protein ZipA
VITLLAIIAVVVLVAGFGGNQLRKREPQQSTPLEDDRLKRLEQAVDAIAIEVERISEAQRFTTKLLSERHAQESQTPAAAKQPARSAPPPEQSGD